MFVGRNEFLDDLSALWRKSTSSLVACRGVGVGKPASSATGTCLAASRA